MSALVHGDERMAHRVGMEVPTCALVHDDERRAHRVGIEAPT